MKKTSLSDPIQTIIADFSKVNALVIGDVMLDTYLFGSVNRISPEAPVPIVDIEKTESRLGGAANVALNIKSLGGKVTVCSVAGKDAQGKQLLALFKKNGLSVSELTVSAERITTEKTRVFSRNHQLLRYDREDDAPLSAGDEKKMIARITRLIHSGKFKVVILQDYNKGVLTKAVIKAAIAESRRLKIPVAVDPKKQNFFEYRSATLFKPNLREIKDALNVDVKKEAASLKKAASLLHEKLNHALTLITLSESGSFITDHRNAEIIPASVRNVADVSGAGDTVLAVAALCLALNVDYKTLALLSNVAGGLACEEVGVNPVTRRRLEAAVEF